MPGMSTSRNTRSKFFSVKQFEGGVRVFDADGLELGFFERVDDGAAGNGLVVHDQDVGGGNFLFFGRGAAFKQEAEKIHARRRRCAGWRR